ncbi:hypothetical protein CVT26_016184 [Gymnopilus dilepis]|uniref:Yeast cell wall synthesis Kre9/Knh1-like N-terminal domain-containing protein n=1 Tax=Gymnopilus dilepis TaxID=231916 RepID=A0A409XYW6_9AGAR|nr:hypothetical protein CVT26_016184 [Gymnopilus dilepis]
MFSAQAFAALLALAASPLLVRADVTPLTPAPGDSFNAGTTCTTTWSGDSNSTTAWKNMAIELMTGPNLDMIHLTTVATNQDGTQSGSFSFPCPPVTINAPIYFFQYSAPGTTVKEWTTRFTIASSSGQTVAAPNATQPESNDPIPWGAGALQDPSTATPAPSFAADDGDAPGSVPAGGVTPSSTPASAPAKTAPLSSPSGMVTQLSTSSSVPATSSSANASAPAASTTSGAVAAFSFNGQMGVLSAAALVFTAFLW